MTENEEKYHRWWYLAFQHQGWIEAASETEAYRLLHLAIKQGRSLKFSNIRQKETPPGWWGNCFSFDAEANFSLPTDLFTGHVFLKRRRGEHNLVGFNISRPDAALNTFHLQIDGSVCKEHDYDLMEAARRALQVFGQAAYIMNLIPSIAHIDFAIE